MSLAVRRVVPTPCALTPLYLAPRTVTAGTGPYTSQVLAAVASSWLLCACHFGRTASAVVLDWERRTCGPLVAADPQYKDAWAAYIYSLFRVPLALAFFPVVFAVAACDAWWQGRHARTPTDWPRAAVAGSKICGLLLFFAIAVCAVLLVFDIVSIWVPVGFAVSFVVWAAVHLWVAKYDMN